jgi:2-polyprenyl-3-methyl-5-hydroxy-6-metoxy-1,4-benzoquinol methylase
VKQNVDMTIEFEVLKQLYARQVEYVANNPDVVASANGALASGFDFMDYLHHKFSLEIIIEREIRIVDMVAPYVRGRVLDWGCHHGHAACLLHRRLGSSVELYGCDVFHENAYRPFYEASGMVYTRLIHDHHLDYADRFFDVVLSNGVLEHVPHEGGSIREIHRILKPGGLFVITALPNKYSYTEAVARFRKISPHDHLYTIDQLNRTLEAAGFRRVASKHFFVLPTMLIGFPAVIRQLYNRHRGAVAACNRALEAIWPVNRLSSNLMFVAQKT